MSQNIIKYKLGLLNLAQELGNISKACKVMGLSRDTFYRYQNAVQEGGVEALIDANRRKPNLQNRVDQSTEDAVVAFALEQPALGQLRTSNELRKKGIFISASGVRSVWLRHNLENFRKRLANLERHVAQTGEVLTEAQVSALEKKRDDDVAYGEIETAHPGYLGSQDTFYVGPSKGLAGYTSRRLSTPTRNGQPPSCIPPKHRLQQLICSMTVYCHILNHRAWESSGSLLTVEQNTAARQNVNIPSLGTL